tara:strand:+ start:259 stop:519 length:261 start_codon:yes stop_codon:yes gene_type:complete
MSKNNVARIETSSSIEHVNNMILIDEIYIIFEQIQENKTKLIELRQQIIDNKKILNKYTKNIIESIIQNIEILTEKKNKKMLLLEK